jgi:antitoxin VapB
MGTKTAKLFTTGRSQAVRLPVEFRFEGKEVFIRRDERTGDVILSRRPADWEGLFSLYEREKAPDDFLDEKDRAHGTQDRDPFAGWSE